jgi:hypothetical protein
MSLRYIAPLAMAAAAATILLAPIAGADQSVHRYPQLDRVPAARPR